MAKDILIKPMITEKAEILSEDRSTYSFVVNKKANEVEIRNAVEAMYNVSVASVNTMIVAGKRKIRNTRKGVQVGMSSSYKKAMVTLAPGEEIDLFGDI